MTKPKRTPGATNAPGGRWHATPASARKAKPLTVTLTPEARAALDALVRRAGPRMTSAEVSAAIVGRARRLRVPVAKVNDIPIGGVGSDAAYEGM